MMIEVTIKIDRAQYCFLRDRYGRRDGIKADKLIRMAVLEVVAMQAQKELDESGYNRIDAEVARLPAAGEWEPVEDEAIADPSVPERAIQVFEGGNYFTLADRRNKIYSAFRFPETIRLCRRKEPTI